MEDIQTSGHKIMNQQENICSQAHSFTFSSIQLRFAHLLKSIGVQRDINLNLK